jgi:hypothetical protein
MYEAASKDAEASTEAEEGEDKSSKGKKQNKSKADEAVEGEVSRRRQIIANNTSFQAIDKVEVNSLYLNLY